MYAKLFEKYSSGMYNKEDRRIIELEARVRVLEDASLMRIKDFDSGKTERRRHFTTVLEGLINYLGIEICYRRPTNDGMVFTTKPQEAKQEL